MSKLAVIAIGRNEGVRLKRCLESAQSKAAIVIYVDSGSTDKSRELARQLGAEVVELDMSVPFSAARARNAGFAALKQAAPEIDLVQFVDGDCELIDGWITKATDFLEKNPDYTLVCGRRRERFPEKSLYNRICDIEWNTPVGDANASGGDFIVRASAFDKINGFNPNLIAGEEPEMCYRLREAGGKIFRIDADMTWHDADMTRFNQWWLRSKRAGHAYANISHLVWNKPNPIWKSETIRIWVWGLLLPSAILVSSLFFTNSLLLAFAIYPVQVVRVQRQLSRQQLEKPLAWLYALSCVFAKFPEMLGQISYWKKVFNKEQHTIIEYKG